LNIVLYTHLKLDETARKKVTCGGRATISGEMKEAKSYLRVMSSIPRKAFCST
jgi:hypothetical protein